MTNNSNTINKLNKKSSTLRIIGLSLIILSFTTFIIFTTHQGSEIEKQQNVIIKKDSALSVIEDSTISFSAKQDSLIKIVNELFRLRNEHKADSIELLYTDTVKSYFKHLRNAPKNLITKSDQHYWSVYPQDKFIITEPITIDSNSKAFVRGQQCYNKTKCLEEIIEIHFSSDKKINYVRAYFAK